MWRRAALRRLARDTVGSVVVETAMIAPILGTLCYGGYEVSAMVARQSELQATAELATEIATASKPENEAQLFQLQTILEEEGKLDEGQVAVKFQYRCGTEAMQDIEPACSEDSLASFVHIDLSDQYTPLWTQWGVGEGFDYNVERTVQIS